MVTTTNAPLEYVAAVELCNLVALQPYLAQEMPQCLQQKMVEDWRARAGKDRVLWQPPYSLGSQCHVPEVDHTYALSMPYFFCPVLGFHGLVRQVSLSEAMD